MKHHDAHRPATHFAAHLATHHDRRAGLGTAVLAAALAAGLPLLASAGVGDAPAAATTAHFGSGCGAQTLELLANSRSTVGNTNFGLVVEGVRATGVVGLLIGASNEALAGRVLPLDLAPFGHAGCALLVDPLDVRAVPTRAGTVHFAAPIPEAEELMGLTLHVQAFAFELATGELSLSGGLTVVIGA
jgi:hypothetical protein